MIKKVEEDVDDYSTKLKLLLEEMDDTIFLAETELSEETAQQDPNNTGLNSWKIFRPNQSLVVQGCRHVRQNKPSAAFHLGSPRGEKSG